MSDETLEEEVNRLRNENIHHELARESRGKLKQELASLKYKFKQKEFEISDLKRTVKDQSKVIEKLNTQIYRMKRGVCYECGEPFNENVPAERPSGLVVGIHVGCY